MNEFLDSPLLGETTTPGVYGSQAEIARRALDEITAQKDADRIQRIAETLKLRDERLGVQNPADTTTNCQGPMKHLFLRLESEKDFTEDAKGRKTYKYNPALLEAVKIACTSCVRFESCIEGALGSKPNFGIYGGVDFSRSHKSRLFKDDLAHMHARRKAFLEEVAKRRRK